MLKSDASYTEHRFFLLPLPNPKLQTNQCLPNMRLMPLFLLLLLAVPTWAQNREFRAAWIATVNNIDFPSRKGLTAQQQQTEFLNLVNMYQQAGFNAVVVQIRSNGDALYPSALEPWSEVLTGVQGQSPQPYYDPLAFMIAACRQRGLEFHAWFNPYRAVANVITAKLDSTKHVAIKHPDWLLAFGNLRILDPGIPEAREYVMKVVMDVVRRYDVDGVHFDDYFYPYPSTGLSYNDDATYARYTRGITNRADWRRDNVNRLVRQLGDSIRTAKPWVKFGISPFGIWQNFSTTQPLGSDTRGLQGFTDIYADSRLWIREGWVDYLAPQIYWNIGYSVADYAKLVPWWSRNAGDRHLYIGQAAYRINSSDVNWQRPVEMPDQLRLNKRYPQVQGSIFYNTTSLKNNPLGFLDSLRQHFYRTPALLPNMLWKSTLSPQPPTQLMARTENQNVLLTWQRPIKAVQELEKVRGYAIYRFADNEPIDLKQPRALLAITPNDTVAFLDNDPNRPANATYVVTALNRLHQESQPSNAARLGDLTNSKQDTPIRGWLSVSINPFSGQLTATYALPQANAVRIWLIDGAGREVATLYTSALQPVGVHTARYDLPTLTPGMYVCVLQTPGALLSKKVMVNARSR